jgi:hypothetical protein
MRLEFLREENERDVLIHADIFSTLELMAP